MEEPELRLIASSSESSKAVVFIHGGWSKECDRYQTYHQWAEFIKIAGWQGPIYHLWWDASASPNAVKCILGWDQLRSRAECVGKKYLPQMLSTQIASDSVSVIAYSLGVRVAYYTLEVWAEQQKGLQDVIFLAGALRRDTSHKWGYVASKIAGKLINVYNSDDPDLLKYKIRASGHSPCGLKKIKEFHPKILNENATDFIGKYHSLPKYLQYLSELSRKGIW